MLRVLCLVLILAAFCPAFAHTQEETPAALYAKAEKAVADNKLDQACAFLDQVIRLDAKHLQAFKLRSRILEAQGKFAEAAADLDRQLELEPKATEIYHQRGCVYFKMGKVKESVADFNKYLELEPARKPSHWQRGISFYYAGQFDEGRQQFEGYQTFDSNDVENAIWRFMCMTKAVGMDKARKDMLKIGPDKRVPMREVYDLYIGKIKPEDVMKAATAGEPAAAQRNRQLFYAHLYLGIYYDLLGDKKQALDHLQRAANDHRIGHYMWDVARVHRDLVHKELAKK